jgi:hypothetical protein
MRKTFINIFILVSFSAMADCYYEITLQHTKSSRMFYLAPNEIDESLPFEEKTALLIIDSILQKETSCRIQEVTRVEIPVTCYKLRVGSICEVLTELGYFLIHRSIYGSIDHSVIYTRWD